MPKTTFTNNVTVVYAAWLNKVFGLDGHKHTGLDEDGSAPFIDLDQLDPELVAILNDLLALKPLIAQLYFGDRVKADVFGGFGEDGAFTGTTNLDKDHYEFTDFTISVGQNVQVTGGVCRIQCTGNVVINGALTGVPKEAYGTGKAWFSNPGPTYNLGASFMGSAGYETIDHTDLAGLTTIRDPGGRGGSGIIIEALGTVTINGTISANGGNAGVATILSGNPVLGGSGGGAGGSVVVQSFSSIQLNGTIDCIGGQGANAYGSNAGGGGGGGGGWGYLIAPSVNRLPNSINVNGGLPGVTNGTGAQIGSAGGSFGGSGGINGGAGQVGKIVELTRSKFTPL